MSIACVFHVSRTRISCLLHVCRAGRMVNISTENVVIEGNDLSGGHGVAIGSETSGWIRHVCTLFGHLGGCRRATAEGPVAEGRVADAEGPVADAEGHVADAGVSTARTCITCAAWKMGAMRPAWSVRWVAWPT